MQISMARTAVCIRISAFRSRRPRRRTPECWPFSVAEPRPQPSASGPSCCSGVRPASRVCASKCSREKTRQSADHGGQAVVQSQADQPIGRDHHHRGGTRRG